LTSAEGMPFSESSSIFKFYKQKKKRAVLYQPV